MYRLIFCLLVPLAAGCAGEIPYTDNSADPESYAQDVKYLVLDRVEAAKKSREPADQISVILLELEGSPNRPKGSYGDIYAELLTEARQIVEECERANGRAPGLDAKLANLAKIAEKLPGTVDISRPPEP